MARPSDDYVSDSERIETLEEQIKKLTKTIEKMNKGEK